jgi:putative transposase
MVDDPAHYRWSSYRSHALGQASSILTPHPLYLALAPQAAQRQVAYRGMFRAQLDEPAIDDIRRALNQNQPLGNARFLARIARSLGERREARPRGRPPSEARASVPGQSELEL